MELLLVFSSLSNWRENGRDTHRCHVPGPTSNRPSRGFSPASYRPAIAIPILSDQRQFTPCSTPDTLFPVEQTEETASVVEGESSRGASAGSKRAGMSKILSGSLVMETYSWRTAKFGDPVLLMSTTGVKGAVFSLPAG